MTSFTDTQDELRYLLGGMCNDTLTDVEAARLESLLCSDYEARKFYQDYMVLHAELYWRQGAVTEQAEEGGFPEEGREMTGATPAMPMPKTVVDEASSVIIEVEPTSLSRRIKRYDSIHWQRHKIRFNAMTAVLTALAWVGFSFFVWLTTTPDDSRPKRDGINVNFVAHITGQYEHQWAEGMRETPPNAFLVPGERLNLVEGFIEITFFDGAVVILEAPVEFIVDSPGAGTLEAGKLTAEVMPEAVGFAVQTPTCRVVDLGTAFALSVDDDQQTEVYVTQGLVEVLPDATAFRSEPIQLRKGERLGLSRESGTIVRDEIAPADFVFDLPTTQRPVTPLVPRSGPVGLIAYWDFNSANDRRVADLSGHGQTGLLGLGNVLTVDGGGHSGQPGDRAFDPTADESYFIATSTASPGRNSFAVSFWVKRTKPGTNTALMDHAHGPGYQAGLHHDIALSVWDDDRGCAVAAPGSGAFEDTRWHHVVFNIDRTTDVGTIYIDGAADSNRFSTADLGSIALGQLHLGTFNEGQTDGTALLDDYAIFDDALTLDEVRGLFSLGLTPIALSQNHGTQEVGSNQ